MRISIVPYSQGFTVPTAAHMTSLADLDGATVCMEKGTPHTRTPAAFFKAKGWPPVGRRTMGDVPIPVLDEGRPCD
jgi:hypothetical protein